jgi:ABC-type Fe3+/spermidine/putrescine transport system ATPase subunit
MSDADDSAAGIRLRNVRKSFDGVDVLRGLDLTVDPGEFCVVVGPSGCGKSVLLKTIAGLIDPDEGRVHVGGEDITDRPVNQRGLGYVFQEFEETLFPHMTVAENVAFGLRQSGRSFSDAEIRRRVDEMLELLAISETRSNAPGELSGGQQQRVELARHLVREAAVMLLDDPLADLDYKLQKRMELEMRRIHAETAGTYVYVTHNQEQALKLADKLVVMNQGVIEQVGTPREIYEQPENAFVGRFVSDSTLLTGPVADRPDERRVTVETPVGPVVARARTAVDPDSRGVVLVRPEDVLVGDEARGADNRFEARIEDRTYTGEMTEFTLSVPADGARQTFQVLRPGNVTLERERGGGGTTLGWDASDGDCFTRLSVVPSVTVDDLELL